VKYSPLDEKSARAPGGGRGRRESLQSPDRFANGEGNRDRRKKYAKKKQANKGKRGGG